MFSGILTDRSRGWPWPTTRNETQASRAAADDPTVVGDAYAERHATISPLACATARAGDQPPSGNEIPWGLHAEPSYRAAAVRSEIVVVDRSGHGARVRKPPGFAQLALAARRKARA